MKLVYKIVFTLLISVLFFSFKSNTPQTKPNNRVTVEMVTNYGTILLELYNETPLHRDNFIKLVSEKAYDNLLFHRVIESFMIQGGDPDSRDAKPNTALGEGDLGYTVPAEFNPDLFHKKGALATAREDNLDRASSAIQFFIVQGKIFNDSLLDIAETRINTKLARHEVINDVANKQLWNDYQNALEEENNESIKDYSDKIDAIAKTYTNYTKYTIPQSHRDTYKTIGGTPHLDQNYTVFGQVIKGIEVVDAIAAVKTDDRNRPIEDVLILSVRILK